MPDNPLARDMHIDRARELVASAHRIVAFTGAGISAESGVPTYRATGGLWKQFNPGQIASPQGFAEDPQRSWRWHNERRAALEGIHPNPGHQALANLEHRVAERGGRMTVATQNIDGLHHRAGSRRVLELHGSILRARCTACDATEGLGFRDVGEAPMCPECGAMLRPDIVWFGEMLPEDVWETARDEAAACDLMITAGTSAVVYPAAGLVELAARAGAPVLEVNLEPTPMTRVAEVTLRGKAGELLPRVVR